MYDTDGSLLGVWDISGVLLQFVLLFNTWCNLNMYFTRFPNTDLLHSFYWLVQSACILTMAFHIDSSLGSGYRNWVFAIAFGISRLSLCFMYLMVYAYIPRSRPTV